MLKNREIKKKLLQIIAILLIAGILAGYSSVEERKKGNRKTDNVNTTSGKLTTYETLLENRDESSEPIRYNAGTDEEPWWIYIPACSK